MSAEFVQDLTFLFHKKILPHVLVSSAWQKLH